MATEEEREEPKQVEQEGDHRAGIVAGSEPTDQPHVRRAEFWRRTGDDEPHPRKEFSEMMLDLGDHASRPVPGYRLILEAAVADSVVAGLSYGSFFDKLTAGPLSWRRTRGKSDRNRVRIPPSYGS
jgi:hypothetical protein